MPLVNEFSWSFSRQNTFFECEKKYWYTYYGSWEGWPRTPYDKRASIDPLAAYLYSQKQIQPLVCFVGSCVHKVIEETLKNPFQKPSKTAFCNRGVELFEKGIQETKEGQWKKAPKKFCNLYEFAFFDPQIAAEPLSKEKEEESKEKIITCLSNWISSPVGEMVFSERAKIVSVEELQFFYIEGFKILVVIDCALCWKGVKDTYILFDWKTGKETEQTKEQLLSYALFAHKALKVPYEDIILSPYYLFQNQYRKIGKGQEIDVQDDELIRLEEKIVTNCRKMTEKPTDDPQHFPYTTKRYSCSSCSFKNLCGHLKYENRSKEELQEVVQQESLTPLYAQ